MAIISAGSATPPGTPPQPVRRSTKHKAAGVQHLMAKHAAKVERKKARKAAALAATAKAQAEAATAKSKKAARK